MNKYGSALIIAASIGILWSSAAFAEISVYQQGTRSNTADTYNNYIGNRDSDSGVSSSNSQNSNNNPSTSGANSRSEQDFIDAQARGARSMEDYKARTEATIEELKQKESFMYPGQPPVEPPKKTVRRELLQKRQAVNGIQGTWLPKKVWENDIDNNLGKTLLKNSKTTSQTPVDPAVKTDTRKKNPPAARIPRNSARSPLGYNN